MDSRDRIEQLNKQISDLPVGYISKKNIRGKECYYRQWKEDGKVKSQYVADKDLDYTISLINRRKELQLELQYESAKLTCETDENRLEPYARRFFMGRHVGVGIQSYEKIITQKVFYVDKTRFIADWWESDDEVTLITRPRRFGKTLNMSMVECFFSNRYADRSDLFQGLNIWKHQQYRILQGTYPVISLSFGAVKMNTTEGIIKQIMFQLSELLFRYQYLKSDCLLTEDEEKRFSSLINTTSPDDALSTVPFLCSVLSRIYEKKVIILLDEYDTPLLEAWTSGIWDDCSVYIRNLFNAMFKTNPNMHRALLTGITKISKESFFSDMNNLQSVSITSDKYATYFGFTEDEVFEAMDEQKLSDKKSVKNWYDGFRFGNKDDIYNPWSIVNYLSSKKLKAYWAHSASNKLINSFFQPGSKNAKYILEDLINGQSVQTVINEEIAFTDINHHPEAFFSLLLSSGYLKICNVNEDGTYSLIPTNREVYLILEDMVKRWFSGRDNYNDFLEAMFTNDAIYMTEYLNRITNEVFSYYDTSGQEPERFYHGFFLGLTMELNDRYIIKSNRESGLGRFDITMEPRKKDGYAIIIEFKVHRPQLENSLEQTAQNALKQIKEKNYAAELISHGVNPNNIYNYGIAFKGKEALVATESCPLEAKINESI